DIVGAKSGLADAEIIKLACDAFDALFPSNYVMRVGNRKILDGILEYAAVPGEKKLSAILAIDKLPKIGAENVEKELLGIGIDGRAAKKILELISIEGKNGEIVAKLEKSLAGISVATDGFSELKLLLSYIDAFGVSDKVRFSPSLARGLNYYTGTIFEAFIIEGKITSSIAAGGRYDDLIGNFAGAREKIPAVGISFGLDVICEALKDGVGITSNFQKPPDVYVCIAAKEQDAELENYAIRIVGNFRKANIPSFLDLSQRSIGKNLEFASKKGYKYAAIAGMEDLKGRKVKLKDLISGEEKTLALNDAVNAVA
ncbi:MAG: HisS family protein, partial [Candidatus Micrarchaeota archaeon]